MQMFKAFVIANRGWKANCHFFFQNVSKRSSVSRAHITPHTYTARVEWCGIGHWELKSSLWDCTTCCNTHKHKDDVHHHQSKNKRLLQKFQPFSEGIPVSGSCSSVQRWAWWWHWKTGDPLPPPWSAATAAASLSPHRYSDRGLVTVSQ